MHHQTQRYRTRSARVLNSSRWSNEICCFFSLKIICRTLVAASFEGYRLRSGSEVLPLARPRPSARSHAIAMISFARGRCQARRPRTVLYGARQLVFSLTSPRCSPDLYIHNTMSSQRPVPRLIIIRHGE